MHRFLGNGLPLVKRLTNFTSGLPTSPALLPCLRVHRHHNHAEEHGGSFCDLSLILDRSSTFSREKVGAIPAHLKTMNLNEKELGCYN